MFKDLFKNDYIEGRTEVEGSGRIPELPNFNPKEVMDRLFADDFAEVNDLSEEKEKNNGEQKADDSQENLYETYEPNTEFEVDGKICETDDEGRIFKVDGELLPNAEYTIGGITYKTDAQRRIISCDGNVKQTPEGERDQDAQRQAGGEDRREGDQGGHIIARILGGAKGIENLLAIRETINKGPYKTMENEIYKALDQDADVQVHVDVKYDGDSSRPSKIIVTYDIDSKETVVEFDNEEGSTDLLNSVEEKVDPEKYDDLKQEIADANEDGGSISVISVKTEYNVNGDVVKVTVITRDESCGGPNEKRVLLPKEGAE